MMKHRDKNPQTPPWGADLVSPDAEPGRGRHRPENVDDTEADNGDNDNGNGNGTNGDDTEETKN